jgi:hypothetical protein
MNTFIYEKPRTEGTQYTIIAEDGSIKIIRLYHRLFEMAEVQKLLNDHHFKVENIYNNLKGEPLTENSETYRTGRRPCCPRTEASEPPAMKLAGAYA